MPAYKFKRLTKKQAFQSPQHLEDKIQSYFTTYVPRTKEIPDLEALALYLGVTRKTLMKYASENEKYNDIVEFAKERILACQKQLAYRGHIKSDLYKFEVTNNHDYNNQKVVKTENINLNYTSKVGKMTRDEVKEEIKRLRRIALAKPKKKTGK
jgi:DNA-binding XRE family transcriptional regulator